VKAGEGQSPQTPWGFPTLGRRRETIGELIMIAERRK
jgi:hypothetical protein